MGSIRCSKAQCKFNKPMQYGLAGRVCKAGAGYDYGGGDVEIAKSGYCKTYKKRKEEPQ